MILRLFNQRLRHGLHGSQIPGTQLVQNSNHTFGTGFSKAFCQSFAGHFCAEYKRAARYCQAKSISATMDGWNLLVDVIDFPLSSDTHPGICISNEFKEFECSQTTHYFRGFIVKKNSF